MGHPMGQDTGGKPRPTGTRSALSADEVRAFTDRAPRCKVAVAVMCASPGEATTQFARTELVNISSSGMLVHRATRCRSARRSSSSSSSTTALVALSGRAEVVRIVSDRARMGLRFVSLDGAGRDLVDRLVEAGDGAPEVPTAPGYAPPAVEFEHGSVRVRLSAATAGYFTYNPLLHIGVGGCFLPAETDVPLGTGYQLDILDATTGCWFAAGPRWRPSRIGGSACAFVGIDRATLQALRAEIAKLCARRRAAEGPDDAGRAPRTRCPGRRRHGRARRGARGRHPAGAARLAAGREQGAGRSDPRRRSRPGSSSGQKPGPRVSVVGARARRRDDGGAGGRAAGRGLDPAALMGSVVIVPVLRPGGRLSRPGRPARPWRFPGDAAGKRGARDAFALFSDIVVGASALVVLGVPGRGAARRGRGAGRLSDPRVRRLAPRSGAARCSRRPASRTELLGGRGRRRRPGRRAVRRRRRPTRPTVSDARAGARARHAAAGVLGRAGEGLPAPAPTPGRRGRSRRRPGARARRHRRLPGDRPRPGRHVCRRGRRSGAWCRRCPGPPSIVAARVDGLVVEAAPCRTGPRRGDAVRAAAAARGVGAAPARAPAGGRRRQPAARSDGKIARRLGRIRRAARAWTSVASRPRSTPARGRARCTWRGCGPSTRRAARTAGRSSRSRCRAAAGAACPIACAPPCTASRWCATPRGGRSGGRSSRPRCGSGRSKRRIAVTLTNRGDMLFPVLIGRTALGPRYRRRPVPPLPARAKRPRGRSRQ